MQANRLIFSIAALLILAGCGSQRTQEPAARSPAQVKAEIVRLLPAKAADPQGWATDIQVAFTAQDISPTTQNLCSVLAVTEQESTFQSIRAYRAWARSPATRSTVVPPRHTFPACW